MPTPLVPDLDSLLEQVDVLDLTDPVDALDPSGGAPAVVVALDAQAMAGLLARIVRQDESALTALYDALHRRVFTLALHVVGDAGCAEEVLQDTFWQIWRQAPRFDPQRGSAIAWIMSMSRSRALDARRVRSRDVVQALRTEIDETIDFEDPLAVDPADLLDTVEQESALHATLATLDPLKRQLIALVFYRGLTHSEVAQHTGLPLGTVKSHLRRTLLALRTGLGEDFNAERFGGPN